ncbi:MAG: chloramphenicol phosphotransferase, partial [Armatimonadetes bacterium]|nr:chloramphenicol phosphotransferase [Armatimonadota bacterium]
KDRTLGQARRQFDIIHAHGVYDLQVDTSISSADECALAIKRRLQGPAFDAFARLKVKLSAGGEY